MRCTYFANRCVRYIEPVMTMLSRRDGPTGFNYRTGQTTLAFATHGLGRANLPDGDVAADVSAMPLGVEIVLIADSVPEAYLRALSAGVVSIKEPVLKPRGQTVAYVRCPDGTLVELCSEMGAENAHGFQAKHDGFHPRANRDSRSCVVKENVRRIRH
ncbi:product [Burkholderia humptydooensis MSMB43]|nr:product [Burkholderia humptydooensis MSMB43]